MAIGPNFAIAVPRTPESFMHKSKEERSYRNRDNALMSAISALHAELAGTDIACEAIGLFLVIVDLAARSGSVRNHDLERHAGEKMTKQGSLDALQSAGVISIRQTADIPGMGFEITVTDPQLLEEWRHDVA